MGLVVLSDWLGMWTRGLVVTLFAPMEAGGMGNPTAISKHAPLWLYELLPPEYAAGLVFGGGLLCIVCVTVGLFGRLAAFGWVLISAQFALALSPADRGIDMLMRNVFLILAFSSSHRVWSVDAWRKTGTYRGDGSFVPAWPRYVLIAQLVILYFTAGVQKVSTAWTPLGGWSALYYAMRDPAMAMGEMPWLDSVYPLTQILTAGTWFWEWLAPLLLIAVYFRETSRRPGRAREWFNRVNFRTWYLVVGALFHIGTALTLQLGVFPWAVLSLYPALYHPSELTRGKPDPDK